MGLPLVGVVLVNYNGLDFMPQCLESLARSDYSNYRIVMVDNNSTDGSREWLLQRKDTYATDHFDLICLPENTGITGGNNVGMQKCLELGCEEIFLLNNDTVVEPDLLSQLVRAREPLRLLVPRIYFFDSPKILNTNFGDFDFVRGISLLRFYGHEDSIEADCSAEGKMASTCALMFPSDLVREIGMMDENYFMYFDDTDFVARAVDCGYLVKYVPDAKLLHRESSSSGGDALGPLPLYYQTRNRLFFMDKHQKSTVKKLLFFAYFSITRLAYLAKWSLKRDAQSLFAFRSAIGDYRKRQFGYAHPTRYRLH